MTSLSASLEKYLTTRRALGFQLGRTAQLLGQFVADMDRAGLATITTEAAIDWATQPEGAHPSWWGARLGTVR